MSGHAPLERRSGLYPAVQAVEEGRAKVIVFSDSDRAFRNAYEQTSVVRRVEVAGGAIHCADIGRLVDADGTDDEWFNGSLHGLLNEKQWRTIRSRSMRGQDQAVKAGKIPMRLIPGLRRAQDGSIELAPKHRAVTRAFKLRLEGKTILEVRAYLAGRGVVRSYNGVKSLLASPQAIGEVVYRGHRFPAPALIDRETWRQVQLIKVPRGRKPKSDRLLARLGVLRCGNCGARMVVGMQTITAMAAARGKGQEGTQYPFYRCGAPRGDCDRGVTISAPTVEQIVSDAVREAIADVEGRASAEHNAREAAVELELAQAELDALIGLLDPLEPAAGERLSVATERRDVAQDHLDQLGGLSAARTVTAAADWDSLSLDGRRALIRAVVARAVVRPGRGAGRVSVEFVGE